MAEKVDAFFVIAAALNRDARANDSTTTRNTGRIVEAAKVLGFTDAEIVQLLCRLDGALVSQGSPYDLPNNIRELREKRGFSMKKLADHVGTSAPQIQRLELGQRRLTVEWMGGSPYLSGRSPGRRGGGARGVSKQTAETGHRRGKQTAEPRWQGGRYFPSAPRACWQCLRHPDPSIAS